MADTELSDAFDDELLSAYVDGELDEAQRALVEQRLRDDPRARQLASELQDLSETLRALPREQVGKEFREGVLRHAEEKMVSVASRGDRGSLSRRWVWAALAIAAALILTIYQPEVVVEEQQLAKAKPQAGGRSVPELRARAENLPEESSAAEAAEEVVLVHIALADIQTGRQRFDELLASNRIDVESESPEPEAPQDKAKEVGAIALSSPEAPPEPEFVLVEASAAQIENLLMACSADTKNLNSLSFETQNDSRLPVDRWRRLERKGKAVAKTSARAPSSFEAEGVGSAAKALAVTSGQDEAKSTFTRNESNQTVRQEASVPRGRATRLGSDLNRLRGQKKTTKRLDALVDGEESSVGDRAKAQQSKPDAQIRVLFVLHRAELPSDSAVDITNKKAATGK